MQSMPDLSEILRLAQTPEGQKFLTLLQGADSTSVNSALSSVKKGDYTSAKQALSGLLDTPEGKALLRSLGGNHG